MNTRAKILAFLKESLEREQVDTGEAVDLLEEAVRALRDLEYRTPVDVLNDALTHSEERTVLLLEIVPTSDVEEEYLTPALRDAHAVVRLDVLVGEEQVGDVYYGMDVLDAIERLSEDYGPHLTAHLLPLVLEP
jgi:hypothetical protein